MGEVFDVIKIPKQVRILAEDEVILEGGGRCESRDIMVELVLEQGELVVFLQADCSPVREIMLSWEETLSGEVLGDHWERSYGDLEWTAVERAGVMPWYFLNDSKDGCRAYGVKVQPGAMCWWEINGHEVRLHLDVRCGGEGVLLGGRRLQAARVLMKHYAGRDAFKAGQDFCRCMSEKPLHCKAPVYGSNNWYYAYGKSSREEILRDTAYLASMTEGLDNRPFMVIDDGWQSEHSDSYNGGPWSGGNADYGDMGQLAADMKKYNVRPGIWFRPLLDRSENIPKEWRLMRDDSVLDISVPEVIAHVQEDLRRIAGWGFELVKHDFSTYDLFGYWGMQMGSRLTDGGWHFQDTSRTTAEIIIGFYEAVLEASEGMLVLGCNCIGHLGAGLLHLNRTGDDTSGMEWERTKKMGVNTLAFRMMQQGAFPEVDADCAGITEHIAWEKNRQWMELLSVSGTPFFVSVKPGLLNEEQKEQLRRAYRNASQNRSIAVPLDWKETKTPQRWQTFEGIRTFEW